jgi:hypothetical protein
MNIRTNEPVKEPFILNKKRNYRNIVSDTYSLMISKTRTLFLSVYPLCLLVGIMSAVMLYAMRTASFLQYVYSAVYILLFVFITSLLIHIARKVLSDYGSQDTMVRFNYKKDFKGIIQPASATSLVILLNVLVSFTLLLSANFINIPMVMAVSLLLITFLQVPFTLATYHQALNTTSVAISLKYGFRNTFRHFGATFFLLFISTIIICALSFIFCLPLEILSLSISLSDLATIQGDPTDIPSYMFTVYYFLAVVLLTMSTYFLLIYIIPQILHISSLLVPEEK